MILRLVLFILQLFASAPMTATWARPGVVDVAFTQDARTTQTCLARRPLAGQPVLVQCWVAPALPAGPVRIRVGGQSGVDGAFRGAPGDTWVVSQDGRRRTAALRGVAFFPLLRR